MKSDRDCSHTSKDNKLIRVSACHKLNRLDYITTIAYGLPSSIILSSLLKLQSVLDLNENSEFFLKQYFKKRVPRTKVAIGTYQLLFIGLTVHSF